MLVVGAITVVLGVFGAHGKIISKRVLAYSTVTGAGTHARAIASGALLAAVSFFSHKASTRHSYSSAQGPQIKATGKGTLPR